MHLMGEATADPDSRIVICIPAQVECVEAGDETGVSVSSNGITGFL